MPASLPPNPDPALNLPITPELVRRHGLLPEEYQQIERILGRTPTLTELGIFSVMWSEHCSYKNSRAILKGFPKEKQDPGSPYQILVRMQEENAGVVDIGEGWAICFKIESHNHPSAVEPFEGAATGVGGIVRDIFTMGARPIALTNSLRFGNLENPNVQRLFRGVVHGISHYGNCLGIPNIGGDVYFDDCYEGNPLVNALCLGILRKDEIKRGAATGIGNPVYYVGAATGRDGLGGASFASRELSEESAADRPAVQKGDPFMEKLLLEACLEMMQVPGLVVGIQDMGAAGLTCSSCETAARGRSGIAIDLDLVPQRETGMNAYEIMLSESQERMLVIVKKGREREIETIFSKWDLHAVQIGEVTSGEDMVVRHRGVVVAHIPALSLTEDAPVYQREAREPPGLSVSRAWTSASIPDLDWAALEKTLPLILADPTISCKAWVYRQYDHMVMASTAVAPGSDAGVIRLRLGEGREKYLALANDCNNRYCALNPYRGGQIAIAECLRNLACSGARGLAMTDNLNFGNPYKPEVFYAIRESVRGLADACRFFDIPVLGGNVSFYNENPQGAIDPTPTVSIAGIIERKEEIMTQFIPGPGLDLLLLGGWPHELGGSYYLKVVHQLKTGDAPALDLEAEKRLQETLLSCIADGLVKAAHDLSEGGLLTAVCEMLFGPVPGLGASLAIDFEGRRLDETLFGESQGRVILAVERQQSATVLARARSAALGATQIGVVDDSGLLTLNRQVQWTVPTLKQVWQEAIPAAMERSTQTFVG